MKTTLTVMSLALSLPALAGDYHCYSRKDAPIYYSDQGQWKTSFTLTPTMRALKDLTLKTTVNPILGVAGVQVKKSADFVARNPRYKGHYKYVVEDAWCNYSFVLPPDAGVSESFKGLVYSVCEAGSGGPFALYCHQI